MTGSCIVCHAPLEHLNASCTQPSGGLDFVTEGHYGSTVFDPMDETVLHISVCDTCLKKEAARGNVVVGEPTHVAQTRFRYKIWKSGL